MRRRDCLRGKKTGQNSGYSGQRVPHWEANPATFRYGSGNFRVLREILENAGYSGYRDGSVRTLDDMDAGERKALEEKYGAKIAER